MYCLQHYKIDWDKVETLEDIKKILKGLEISVGSNYKNLDEIRHFLVLEDKEMGTLT